MTRIVAFLVLVLFSCSESGQGEQVISKVINATELNQLLKEKTGIQLIDVRTQREFQSGHLKKAKLIDYYKSDFKKQLDALDKDKPVAIYCAVGVRSNNTLKMLKVMGFKEAYDLSGGINSWVQAGLPVQK